ncbi:hypothetical protein COR50_00420 [Chitinophaga caeni]|uniref:Phytase-like domain-containing protein n=1 Tax=Chitinophaga caeni TaxID=2029983 RepID=A0A291QPH8_9BACT|nr:esterase-like activity of phytase family protein [Chitinophaga caeni]ATL45744.1 hypothetical protein COR50_00420 [Chitinophaga caeni]
MKSLYIPLLIICSLGIGACKTVSHNGQVSITGRLIFHDQWVLPEDTKLDNIPIGGLSGIDYDAGRNVYYLVCDDRSDFAPARFYTAQIHISGYKIDSVNIIAATSLKMPDGNTYPSRQINPALTPDPEALRYDAANQTMIWSSEGERNLSAKPPVLSNPSINRIDLQGKFIDSFPVPGQLQMSMAESGSRRNAVLEGIAITPSRKYLYASVEGPLYQDGPEADTVPTESYCRIIRYDLANRQPAGQFLFKLHPVADIPYPKNAFRVNGISDILALDDEKLLVLERSYSTGIRDNTILVSELNLKNASDVSNYWSILKKVNSNEIKAPQQLLLFDFRPIASQVNLIDNVEGMTFGPDLPNGNKSLVFVVDNNFSNKEETQFYLFEYQSKR